MGSHQSSHNVRQNRLQAQENSRHSSLNRHYQSTDGPPMSSPHPMHMAMPRSEKSTPQCTRTPRSLARIDLQPLADQPPWGAALPRCEVTYPTCFLFICPGTQMCDSEHTSLP